MAHLLSDDDGMNRGLSQHIGEGALPRHQRGYPWLKPHERERQK